MSLPTPQRQSLKDQAIAVLRAHEGEWRTIARDTGLGYHWLVSLANGRIADPGVTRIEKLLAWGRERAA